jgi:hypothetical protein
LWKLKLNCKKIAAFTAIEKRISLKVKKEIVAFHLNNNPLSTAGWCKIG